MSEESTSKRATISKKTRFEIFKRDSFTCQYCGRKAPDVILECDHIKPVSKGGEDDIINYITSCFDCNRGKGDRELSDDTVIEKQRQQLELLQERREQIDMMVDWQRELLSLDDDIVRTLSRFWNELIPGNELNNSGVESLKELTKKFDIDAIMQAMKIARDQYVKYIDGNAIHSSIEIAWSKVGGICNIRKRQRDGEPLEDIYYIRGIIRNRFRYVDDDKALRLIKTAIEYNANIESLKEYSKETKNWSQWRQGIESYIANNGDNV